MMNGIIDGCGYQLICNLSALFTLLYRMAKSNNIINFSRHILLFDDMCIVILLEDGSHSLLEILLNSYVPSDYDPMWPTLSFVILYNYWKAVPPIYSTVPTSPECQGSSVKSFVETFLFLLKHLILGPTFCELYIISSLLVEIILLLYWVCGQRHLNCTR